MHKGLCSLHAHMYSTCRRTVLDVLYKQLRLCLWYVRSYIQSCAMRRYTNCTHSEWRYCKHHSAVHIKKCYLQRLGGGMIICHAGSVRSTRTAHAKASTTALLRYYYGGGMSLQLCLVCPRANTWLGHNSRDIELEGAQNFARPKKMSLQYL